MLVGVEGVGVYDGTEVAFRRIKGVLEVRGSELSEGPEGGAKGLVMSERNTRDLQRPTESRALTHSPIMPQ